MNNIITFCTEHVRNIAVFAFLPIAFAILTLTPSVATAQEFDFGGFDYGFGGGDYFSYDYYGTDSYTYNAVDPYTYNTFDYGYGAGDMYTNTSQAEAYDSVVDNNFDYGYGASEVINDGCCNDLASNDFDYGNYGDTSTSDFDYGYGASEVINDGCCTEQADAPFDYGYGGAEIINDGCCDEPYVLPYEPDYEPYYDPYYEPYYIEPYQDIYAYADYSYPTYTSTYYTPSYTYTYPTYTYPTYTYTQPTYNPPVSQPNPRCTLDALDNTLTEGQSTTLRWTTDHATLVTISNEVNNTGLDGSRTIRPNSTRTYTLFATGPGGYVSCSETVIVTDVETVDERNPRCDAFTVSDSRVEDGDIVTLEWRTTGATDVDINQGVGDVPNDGSRRVRVTNDTTFTLTARDGSETDTCRVSVEVDEPEVENDNVRCDAFTVSDSRVEDGDIVTLEWRTTGATDVDINNGVGDVANDGSRRVGITDDTTFTLTARDGSDTDTCRVSVEVDEDEDDDNDVVNPRCELTASDTRIESGDRVTLRWDNTRTDEIELRDNHGNRLIDTDRSSADARRYNEDNDDIVVSPNRTTTYTLTASRGSRERDCRVTITVDDTADENTVTLTSKRIQDTISLAGVPYTGFEAGPVLTFIFYTAIVLWGLAVAYALVIRKETEMLPAEVGHAPVASTMSDVSATPIDMKLPETSFLPKNLPTDEEIDQLALSAEDSIKMLEERAHAQYTLISSDALRFIEGQGGTTEEQIQILDRVIALAKSRFPKEGDWVVLNKERVLTLLG